MGQRLRRQLTADAPQEIPEFSSLKPAEFRQHLRGAEHTTERTTSFSRHEDLFAHLKEDVVPGLANGKGRLDGLVIGPGLSPPMVVGLRRGVGEMKWSYEHLQLADIFECIRRGRDGGFDYGITVLEKDQLIAESVRRQDTLVMEPPGGPEYPQYKQERLIRYGEGFMPWARKREIGTSGPKTLLKVPPEMMDRIRVVEGDILDSDIPKSDLILYLTVSIYVPQDKHPQIAEKLSAALNAGGIIVTNNNELIKNAEKYGLACDGEKFRNKTAVLRKT